jgi:hypothetical protein
MQLRYLVLLFSSTVVLAACGDTTGVRPRPGSEPPAPQSTTGELIWYDLEPRVLVPGGTGLVQITAKFTRDVPARFVLRNSFYPFTAVGDQWVVSVPQAEMLEQYRAGDLHHIAGRIEVGTTPSDYNVIVNVAATSTVTPVAITSLGAGVKATARVINIRTDSTFGGRTVPSSILREAYRYLGDDYDFLMVVEAVRSPRNRSYTSMRNQVSGIGLGSYDQGRVFGSAARLQGVVQFPSDDFFDLAETGTLHELAHRWIGSTTHT